MATIQHTPGPWKAHLDTGSPPFISRESTASGWICQTVTWMGLDEAKANANMIAAAPQMLDALQRISEMYSYSYDDLDAFEVAHRLVREAIAKATGGQNGQ